MGRNFGSCSLHFIPRVWKVVATQGPRSIRPRTHRTAQSRPLHNRGTARERSSSIRCPLQARTVWHSLCPMRCKQLPWTIPYPCSSWQQHRSSPLPRHRSFTWHSKARTPLHNRLRIPVTPRRTVSMRWIDRSVVPGHGDGRLMRQGNGSPKGSMDHHRSFSPPSGIFQYAPAGRQHGSCGLQGGQVFALCAGPRRSIGASLRHHPQFSGFAVTTFAELVGNAPVARTARHR